MAQEKERRGTELEALSEAFGLGRAFVVSIGVHPRNTPGK